MMTKTKLLGREIYIAIVWSLFGLKWRVLGSLRRYGGLLGCVSPRVRRTIDGLIIENGNLRNEVREYCIRIIRAERLREEADLVVGAFCREASRKVVKKAPKTSKKTAAKKTKKARA